MSRNRSHPAPADAQAGDPKAASEREQDRLAQSALDQGSGGAAGSKPGQGQGGLAGSHPNQGHKGVQPQPAAGRNRR